MVGNHTNLLEITDNQQFLSNPSAITHKKKSKYYANPNSAHAIRIYGNVK